MASNARGRKGPVNSRTSTRKKSPAAKAKQSPASAAAPMAEAAPTAVHGKLLGEVPQHRKHQRHDAETASRGGGRHVQEAQRIRPRRTSAHCTLAVAERRKTPVARQVCGSRRRAAGRRRPRRRLGAAPAVARGDPRRRCRRVHHERVRGPHGEPGPAPQRERRRTLRGLWQVRLFPLDRKRDQGGAVGDRTSHGQVAVQSGALLMVRRQRQRCRGEGDASRRRLHASGIPDRQPPRRRRPAALRLHDRKTLPVDAARHQQQRRRRSDTKRRPPDTRRRRLRLRACDHRQYVRGLVARTINTLTLLLDGERTPSAWVPPTNATDASGTPGQHMWKLGRCPSSDAPAHVTSLYPVLPALEIAHDAYRRFRNVAEDVPLRGLEAYSAEQVFFLTACHVTCWTNSAGHRMSPECTDAMSNFAPFADAFDCPAGSPMNPHDRCRFF
ncbi:uncharacterized protein [Dermacentor albipictus]|uniref:uncharacterized protein isoform X1 n=1 Tax=Dermacentor albipictus TaxID=60249 RepID=UPI0038FC1632